jgi:methylenetetrahydrofolate reductase (NADH)
MRINKILEKKEQGVAFEFFPPRNQKSEDSLRKTLKALKKYDPLYVSMTCGAAGTSHEATRKAVSILSEDTDMVVMPHLTCISTRCSAIREVLDYYKSAGIENIMALRGDILPDTDTNNYDNDLLHAKSLIDIIKEYGHFDIAAAVYPEGHIESISIEEDLKYTKEKINSGVNFAVTQMFFDNSYYYDFLERMNKIDIKIPILPGILPLTNIAKVKEFASICRSTIPTHIEDIMGRFSSNPKDMEKAGIDLTIKQCKDLVANGFKHLHFFTLNRASVMQEIIDEVF